MSVSAEGLIWLVWRLRCGNDAPWKSGKSQKSDFPPIPTTLGNPHKTRVSTFPPATAAEGTMKANTAEPLESRGCSDSCTEPIFISWGTRFSPYGDTVDLSRCF